jgi:hypothetical protein
LLERIKVFFDFRVAHLGSWSNDSQLNDCLELSRGPFGGRNRRVEINSYGAEIVIGPLSRGSSNQRKRSDEIL